MAESRTGNGVGKLDQSWVQQRVAQAGEEELSRGGSRPEEGFRRQSWRSESSLH